MKTRSENLVYLLVDEQMDICAYGNLKTLLESVNGYDKNTYLSVGARLRNGSRKVKFETSIGNFIVSRVPILRAPYNKQV